MHLERFDPFGCLVDPLLNGSMLVYWECSQLTQFLFFLTLVFYFSANAKVYFHVIPTFKWLNDEMNGGKLTNM